MKITKRQLRRIIKESSAGVGEKLQFHRGTVELSKDTRAHIVNSYAPRPATVTKREPTEFVGKNGQPMEMVTVEFDEKRDDIHPSLNEPVYLSLVPQGMSVAELISKDGHVMNRRKEAFPQIFPVKLAPGEESGDPEYDRIRAKAANKEYSHPDMVYNEPYERRKKNKRDKAAAAKDPQGVTESRKKMKITKRQLRQIIKEEKARLMREMHPRAEADNAYMDVLEGVEELMAAIKKGARLGAEPGAEDDEIYIMTGAAEGLTVKVVRRGR